MLIHPDGMREYDDCDHISPRSLGSFSHVYGRNAYTSKWCYWDSFNILNVVDWDLVWSHKDITRVWRVYLYYDWYGFNFSGSICSKYRGSMDGIDRKDRCAGWIPMDIRAGVLAVFKGRHCGLKNN